MAQTWHDKGMARIRVSTTVDEQLLERARALPAHTTDAALLDAALATLLARHREAEIDANYATYAGHPLSEPDAWGDLESWLEAARNA